MSERNATILTFFSLILLVISAVLIVQLGLPALNQMTVTRSDPAQVDDGGGPWQIINTPLRDGGAVVPAAPDAPTATPSGDADAGAAIDRPSGDVAALLDMINGARQRQGLAALETQPALAQFANEISQSGATRASFDAVTLDSGLQRLSAQGYYAASLASQLAISSDMVDAIRDVLSNGGNTPILSADVTHVGIGVSGQGGLQYGAILLADEIQLTAPGATFEQVGGASRAEQEALIINLLNAARSEAGLGPVVVNAQLSQAAQAHSEDQAIHDVLTHDGSDNSTVADRAQRQGYVGRMTGENVLSRNNLHAAAAFDQWWNSPPHHENMMQADFTQIGIGFALSGSDTYYYTMVLGG